MSSRAFRPPPLCQVPRLTPAEAAAAYALAAGGFELRSAASSSFDSAEGDDGDGAAYNGGDDGYESASSESDDEDASAEERVTAMVVAYDTSFGPTQLSLHVRLHGLRVPLRPHLGMVKVAVSAASQLAAGGCARRLGAALYTLDRSDPSPQIPPKGRSCSATATGRPS